MTITNLINKIFSKEHKEQIHDESELYNFIINYSFERTVIGSIESNPFDKYCVTRVYFKKNDINSDLCVWLCCHPKHPMTYKCILDFGTYTTFDEEISKETYLKILEYLKKVSCDSLNTFEDSKYLQYKYLK